jgi:hypothetical protein
LVANFQMLKPLLKNESLKKRLVREGKGNVGSRLVTVLFEACILDCQTLVADNDDFNPSLRTLVRPFLSRNRQKNRTLLERLASFHTERPITLNKRQRAARLRRFDRNCRPARSGLGSAYKNQSNSHDRWRQNDCAPRARRQCCKFVVEATICVR